MDNLKKLALIGAGTGIGILALSTLTKAKPQPQPQPEPREPAPIINPSFEDGLNGWQTIRYAPHPNPRTNNENHLIETSNDYATNGIKSLHLRAHKTTEDSNYLRNVQCKAWQDIDLSQAVKDGFIELLVDIHAELNFDAVEAPWGGYYAYAEVSVGNQRWWKHLKGVYNETAVFDLTKISFPTQIRFITVVWDKEPDESICELWADNIGIR